MSFIVILVTRHFLENAKLYIRVKFIKDGAINFWKDYRQEKEKIVSLIRIRESLLMVTR